MGGAGNDTLTGGAGKDIFLFDAKLNVRSNVDLITDSKHGQDKLHLSKSIFKMLATGKLSTDNFTANENGTALDANHFIIYNTKTGALLYDADGSGSGAAVQFATLKNKPQNLTASDFLVVE